MTSLLSDILYIFLETFILFEVSFILNLFFGTASRVKLVKIFFQEST
jgi:hypothetical protein